MGLRVDYSMAAKAEGTVWASWCGPMTKFTPAGASSDHWRSQWHPAISFGILRSTGVFWTAKVGGTRSIAIRRTGVVRRCRGIVRLRRRRRGRFAISWKCRGRSNWLQAGVGSFQCRAVGCARRALAEPVAPGVAKMPVATWRWISFQISGERSTLILGLRVDYSMATEAEGTVGASWCGPQMKLNRMVDLQSTGRASGTRR